MAETLDQAGTLGAPPADSEFAATPEQGQPAGTQSETPAAEAPAVPVAVQEYEIDGEKYTLDQIKQFREIATNPQKFVASATQKSQAAAELERKVLADRMKWEQDRDSFMNDERTRELVQLRQAIDADPSLYVKVQQALALTKGQQQTDAMSAKLMTEIRQLKDWKAREEWERQQRYTKELEAETNKQLDDFTKAHPEVTGKVAEEFSAFYESRPDIVSFEDAWRLFSYDQILAKTRQSAMDETAAVEAAKLEAVGVPPKAHTKVDFKPDPSDRDFEGAREASIRAGLLTG